MSELTLVIGNKNYSSWSLRPWLAMRAAGIAFHEVKVLLDQPDTPQKIAEWSPSGRIPTLVDRELRIWDSLSICEYVNERFPEAALWPADQSRRAVARSVSAEMHSGFAALRSNLQMDIRSRRTRTWGADVQADIDRICAIWRECRRMAEGGPFLFGRFSIADAMFAPVATRFRTWSIPADNTCTDYRDAILTMPAFLEWEKDGLTEPDIARYR